MRDCRIAVSVKEVAKGDVALHAIVGDVVCQFFPEGVVAVAVNGAVQRYQSGVVASDGASDPVVRQVVQIEVLEPVFVGEIRRGADDGGEVGDARKDR